MKVIAVSLDNQEALELAAQELNYDPEQHQFWMHYAYGDDWFQRTTSSLEEAPRFVRQIDQAWFVVFDRKAQALRFAEWLQVAKATVEHGFRTMRG